MLYNPYSYRITIDENPIPLQRICVLSYLCLLLTKLLFETSFKSFQYNTEGRRLSNYSIKLILCSRYRSRYKGLCQNKKHEFDQYTKGGHFCAAHMALTNIFFFLGGGVNKMVFSTIKNASFKINCFSQKVAIHPLKSLAWSVNPFKVCRSLKLIIYWPAKERLQSNLFIVL